MPKTITIPTEVLHLDNDWPVGGELKRDPSARIKQRANLLVGKRNYAGYGLGLIPAGFQGRMVHEGPLVPGPWAYAFAHAAVIDNHGGTKAELDRERSAGLIYEADLGDHLVLEGTTFEIVPTNNNNIGLVKLGVILYYYMNAERNRQLPGIHHGDIASLREKFEGSATPLLGTIVIESAAIKKALRTVLLAQLFGMPDSETELRHSLKNAIDELGR